MCIKGVDLVTIDNTMVNLDVVAPAVMITCCHNDTIRCSEDGGTVTGGKVHSPMWCATPPIGFTKMAGNITITGQGRYEGPIATAGDPAGVIFGRGEIIRAGNANLGDGDTIQLPPSRSDIEVCSIQC